MVPGIALLTMALVLLKAGWKNQNIVDVVLGRDSRKSKGNVSDVAGVTDYEESIATGNVAGPPNPSHAGTITIDGKPVALWIVPYVRWARGHGWKGRITSGFRTTAEQRALQHGAAGNPYPVAKPGQSNHEGLLYPRGAIDVSDPDGFRRAIASFPGPHLLHQGTAIGDPIHFSATGR